MAAQMAHRAVHRSSHWLLPICSTPASALVCSRGAGGTTTTSTGSTSSSVAALSGSRPKLRTLEDLPRVTPWKMLYNLVFRGYLNRMHELQVYEKQIYGPIYRGGLKSIQLCSAELVEEVLRKEGKFPSRGDMSLWTEYRDMNGLGYGPFTEEGEKWYNLRTMLNKRMLHPKDSLQYGEVINEVVTDLIKRICHLRRGSPTGDLVTNLSNELYRFSLEGISSILFESRLGCLEQEIPAGTQDFIDSIAQMFTNSTAVMVSPKWTRGLLPFWGRYLAAWEGIFKFAGHLVDKKIEAIEQRMMKDQEVEGEYLTYLLSNTHLSHKEVHSSVTELLLAGVDTTSNTMMWTLYLLSTYPEVQATLYEEVSKRVPGDQIPSAQDVTQMPYLKAVIKEVLRMYPVVPMNGRVITEKDVVVGGYYFPKKTTFTLAHYAISHDEKVFPEPWRFRPERWLRDGRPRPNGFASIPFGFGVRGCVGRRIAELELYLALSRIIKLFEIKPDLTMGEVKCHNRIVLVADRQVNFHFLDRRVKTSI